MTGSEESVVESLNCHPHPHYRASCMKLCWGLRKAGSSVLPQKLCRTGAVIVGVGEEIMVVSGRVLIDRNGFYFA